MSKYLFLILIILCFYSIWINSSCYTKVVWIIGEIMRYACPVCKTKLDIKDDKFYCPTCQEILIKANVACSGCESQLKSVGGILYCINPNCYSYRMTVQCPHAMSHFNCYECSKKVIFLPTGIFNYITGCYIPFTDSVRSITVENIERFKASLYKDIISRIYHGRS